MRTKTTIIALAFASLVVTPALAQRPMPPPPDPFPEPAPEPVPEPMPMEPGGEALPPGDGAMPPADGTAPMDGSVDGSVDASATLSTDEVGGDSDGKLKLHKITIGLKAGGLFPQPLSDLGTSYLATLELGWWFAMKQRLGVTVDVAYTAPKSSGSETDPRVPGGSYHWNLEQRQLIIAAALLYRLPMGKLSIYGGIGPRIFLEDSHITGEAGAAEIEESTEQSTLFGFGIPVGVGYRLGPGDLLGELLFDFSKIEHKVTGEANMGALSFSLGYRFGF